MDKQSKYPVYGSADIMSQKAHGTCDTGVMENLRWGVDSKTADQICCYNRHYAEHSGYFIKTNFLKEVDKKGITTYYDPVSGQPLFKAPIGRTFESFQQESAKHGWPSFRDEEVVWENVRVLKDDGEVVSLSGVHLGHLLPDQKGNRYCINLVSVCGMPPKEPSL